MYWRAYNLESLLKGIQYTLVKFSYHILLFTVFLWYYSNLFVLKFIFIYFGANYMQYSLYESVIVIAVFVSTNLSDRKNSILIYMSFKLKVIWEG